MISEIMKAMIEFSNGNHHDINHLIKVWCHSKTIGELENLDSKTQFILEIAAICHDIACPLCRQKYGNTNGKYQEKEGQILVREFLAPFKLAPKVVDRVAYLVSHHHTLDKIEGTDYQILIEADYLVNAQESNYSHEAISNFAEHYFKTKTGKELLKSMYQL